MSEHAATAAQSADHEADASVLEITLQFKKNRK